MNTVIIFGKQYTGILEEKVSGSYYLRVRNFDKPMSECYGRDYLCGIYTKGFSGKVERVQLISFDINGNVKNVEDSRIANKIMKQRFFHRVAE